MFKLAYGTLGLPFGSLDELTVLELYWLLDNMHEKKKEEYEMLSYIMKNALISANSGKDLPLFNTEENGKTKHITQEERDNTLSLLGNIFEG